MTTKDDHMYPSCSKDRRGHTSAGPKVGRDEKTQDLVLEPVVLGKEALICLERQQKAPGSELLPPLVW